MFTFEAADFVMARFTASENLGGYMKTEQYKQEFIEFMIA